MKINLEELYCFVDEFVKSNGLNFSYNKRKRFGKMSLSELITLRIWFQFRQNKTFKSFYFMIKHIDDKTY